MKPIEGDEISIQASFSDGSCNACQGYVGGQRVPSQAVLVVQLKTITFRLCPRCAAKLIDRLKKIV